MGLQDFWFIALAVLFLGFFVLEGFDFGVGMLMKSVRPRAPTGDRERHERAVLNTIGPVWDGNEVWLITAGGAMFAAFPGMYATLFSGLYLPLLAILVAMIVRICAIEWRGKIDDPKWRTWADVGIAVGSWVPAVLWGVAFAALVRGLPVDADKQIELSITDLINPYTLLGGAGHRGPVRVPRCGLRRAEDRGRGARRRRAVRGPPRAAGDGRWWPCSESWTQLAHGKDWTWLVLGVAVVAQLSAVMLVWSRGGDGWAFALHGNRRGRGGRSCCSARCTRIWCRRR